ncbi:MAG: carboxypeptidase regulatory-like domain-containing protein [Acidobacteria bacterium]|nr:carboxypeptidase regulatory-like domain-containing protein [Acidobacteriota bacterium]
MVLPEGNIELPEGSPFVIKPKFTNGPRLLGLDELNATYGTGLTLSGTFSGPGMGASDVSGTPASGLNMPAMTQEGDYTLSSVRLMKDGKVILDAMPSSKVIRCLGQVLISNVTSSPMTLQEIQAAGIQLGPNNYEAKRFTMTLALGSQELTLKVPVAIPVYNGLPSLSDESVFGPLEIVGSHGEKASLDITVVAANIRPPVDKLPQFDRPGVAHVLRNAFKALLVIPGTVGYLHQFYKTDVVVLNTLPEASPYRVTHLKANFLVPPGLDGQAGTTDDPLVLAAHLGETASAEKSLLGPDSLGRPGRGENWVNGGQSAMATYYLEGMKEGAYPLDFKIEGQFEGGDLGEPIPILGTASGKVLVRNPNFSLVMVHPDIVRKGETYTLEARLTNTTETIANAVSLTIDQARLANVKLISEPTQSVNTLGPGESASFKYQLKAKVTGEVRSGYLYLEGNGSASYQLSVGIGERNIRLNPDTLILPDTLNALPGDLREAMLKVLGQAYSIATAKGAQPAGVLPIPMSVVTGEMANGLSEQGLFLKMGIDRTRVWWDLWKLFMENHDPGFDQLVRTTTAGRELREVFLQRWSWADPARTLPDRLGDMSAFGFGSKNRVIVAIEGGGQDLQVAGQDGTGAWLSSASGIPSLSVNGMTWGEGYGQHLASWGLLAGQSGLLVLTNPSNEVKSLHLSVLAPVADGGDAVLRRYSVDLGSTVKAVLALGVGDGLLKTFSASGSQLGGVWPEDTKTISPEPFQALGVHRYDRELFGDANPYGTQVMVLFNRPVMNIDLPGGEEGVAGAQALIQVEANRPWKKTMPPKLNAGGDFELDGNGNVVFQTPPAPLTRPFPRIASLFLEKPVGPYVARTLTLSSGWKDANGGSLSGLTTWPITSGWLPGGAVVKGKVRKADGTGVPTQLEYWYRQQVDSVDSYDLSTGHTFVEEKLDDYFALVSNGFATEIDGTYQLDFVPEVVSPLIGPFILQAKVGQSQASAGAAVLGNGQTIQMDLVVEGVGTIEGYVLDGNNQPVSGVTVQGIQIQNTVSFATGGGSSTGGRSVTTDANGYYRIEGLKTGAFSLRALKQGVGGLFGVATSGAIDRDGQTVRKDLVLKGRVGFVKVRLLDLDGTSMLNRWIRLGFKTGLVNRTTTSAIADWVYPEEHKTIQGSDWVTFANIPTGDIRVYTPEFPEGFATTFEGYLNPDQTLEVTLRRLSPDVVAKVRIHVVDDQGTAIPGAYVLIGGAGVAPGGVEKFNAQTDGEGYSPFLTRVAPERVAAWAYHPSWNGSFPGESALLAGGQSYTLTVVMPKRTSLQGRVTRGDGTPVRDAVVAIPPIYNFSTPENRVVRTDSNGRYRFESIQTGRAFRVAVVGPEGLTAANQEMPATTEGQSLTFDAVLPDVGTCEAFGQLFVMQADGSRIPTSGWVDIESQVPDIGYGAYGSMNWGLPIWNTRASVQTQLDGNFRATGLPSGQFRITAGRENAIEVRVDGSFENGHEIRKIDLAIRNTFTAALKGKIYQRDGQTPVAKGARVRLLGTNGSELQVESQEEGIYKFPKVIVAGTYQVRVEDPQTGDITVATISIKDQDSVIRNLRLWGRGNLKIKVQNSLGQALSDAVVTLQHGRGLLLQPDDLPNLSQRLRPEHHGELLFEDMIEGLVSIEVKDPLGLVGRGSIEIQPGGGDREITVRLQPVGDVVGSLRRADGTFVPAGRIDAYWVDNSQQEHWIGTSPTFQEGVQGRFIFIGLPAGVIRLRAWDPDSRQMGALSVQVMEGQQQTVEMSTQDLGSVQVTVRLNGQPVVRAGVVLHASTVVAEGIGDFEATTDDQGRAQFMVPPGSFTAHSVDPQSLSTGDLRFLRTPNQAPLELALDLQPVKSLTVRIQPPTGWVGTVLDGWKVMDLNTGRTAHLDGQNQGLLQDLTVGVHALDVQDALGFTRGTFNILVRPDGPPLQASMIQALPLGSLKIRILDAEGAPVPFVMPSLSDGVDLSHIPLFTDGMGEALVFPVLGRRATATYGSVRARFEVTREGEVAEVLLQLAPTASLHGVVRDAEGHPVPYIGVQVWSQSSGDWRADSATDANGTYVVHSIPVGPTILLQAKSLDGRASSVQLVFFNQPENRQVDLVIPVLGGIRARFSDPLRPAMPPMTLQVLAADGHLVASQPLDGLGTAELSGLPALQDLTLRLVWDDRRVVAYTSTIQIPGAGQVKTIEVVLDSFVNLNGWTLDTLNRKVPMTVMLQDAAGGELDRVTTTGDIYDPDQPTFAFRYLHVGTEYHLVGLKEGTQVPVAFKAFTPMGGFLNVTTNLVAEAESALHVSFRTASGSAANVIDPFVVYPNGESLQLQPKGDGTFTASVPARVPVSVKVFNYVLGEDLLLPIGGVTSPDSTLEAELVLPDLGIIRGRVLGADGAPLAGIVKLYDGQKLRQSKTVLGDGVFEFGQVRTVLPMAISVVNGFQNALAIAQLLSPGEIQTQDLKMNGLSDVRVKVKTADGIGVPDKLVFVLLADGTNVAAQRTDATGVARFVGMPASRSLKITTTLGQGYVSKGLTLTFGSPEALVEFTDLPPTTISGRILRANPALSWPEGTRLLLTNGVSLDLPLNPDGTFDTQSQVSLNSREIRATVLVSGVAVVSRSLTPVEGGVTEVNLAAPVFGSVRARVLQAGVAVDGVPVEMDRHVLGTTDLDGYTQPKTSLAGTHELVATKGTEVAWTQVSIAEDGQALTVNLPLTNGQVTLPVSLLMDRLGITMRISDQDTPPLAWGVDGTMSDAFWPTAATWRRAGRSFAWDESRGDIALTRVFTSVGYGVRQELVFKNSGSTARKVRFRLRTGWTPDANTIGTPGQLGGAHFPNYSQSLVWGRGEFVPTGMTDNTYSGQLDWPEFDLQPGETKGLWIGHHRYGFQQEFLQLEGYERALERANGSAPEWIDSLDPRVNLMATASVFDSLPEWNGQASFALRDPSGAPIERIAETIIAKVVPKEALAPIQIWRWYPYEIPGPFEQTAGNLPADGATLRISQPGNTDSFGELPLATGENKIHPLVDRSVIQARILDPGDSEGAGGHRVKFDGIRAHGEEYVQAGSTSHRWLIPPGEISATLVHRDNPGLTVSKAITLGVAQVQAVDLQMPNHGSVTIQVGNDLGAMRLDSGDQWGYTTWSNGSYRFPAVATGTQQVTVSDSSYRWSLSPIEVTTGANVLDLPVGGVRMSVVSGGTYLGGSFMFGFQRNGGGRWVTLANPSTLVLPPDTYTVSFTDPRTSAPHSQVITIAAGSTQDVSFDLTKVGGTVLKVRSNSGKTSQGMGVRITGADGGVKQGYTDANGFVPMGGLAVGTASVAVSGVPNADWKDQPDVRGSVTIVEGATVPGEVIYPDLAYVGVQGTSMQGLALPTSNYYLGGQFTLPNRYQPGVRIAWNGFDGVALGLPISPRYENPSLGLQGILPVSEVTPSTAGQTVSLTYPLGRVRLRVVTNGLPKSGALVRVDFGGTSVPQATSDAMGWVEFPFIPTGSSLSYSVTLGAVTTGGNLQFTGPSLDQDISLPVAKAVVQVRRTNGGVPSGYWNFLAEGGPRPTQSDATSAVWDTLPIGAVQTFTATRSQGVMIGWDYFVDLWEGRTTTTLLSPTQDVQITLPVRAAVQAQFRDLAGNPLVGGVSGDWWLRIVSSTNPQLSGRSIHFGTFDPLDLPEVFTEGQHEIELTSALWGSFGTRVVSVTPDKDGQPIPVIFSADLVRQELNLRVTAGDGQTPLPHAGLSLKTAFATNGIGQLFVPDMTRPNALAEGASFSASVLVPVGRAYSVVAEYYNEIGSWQLEGAGHLTGPALTESIALPITVLRARMNDLDGTSLDSQAIEWVTESTPQRLPMARISGSLYGLWLGMPEGTTTDLTFFDLASGLGQTKSVVMPSLNTTGNEFVQIPDYAWVVSPSLQRSPIQTGDLLMSVDRSAAGLVHPELAQWVYSPTDGWSYGAYTVEVSRAGARLQPLWDLDRGEISLPQGRVRIPASGKAWLAEALPTGGEDPTSAPGAWGALTYSCEAGGTANIQAIASNTDWVDQEVQILDANDLGVMGQELGIRPQGGPDGWGIGRVYLEWQDAPAVQGVRTLTLPIDLLLEMWLIQPSCQMGWEGTWNYSQPSQPPVERPVFKAISQKYNDCGGY